MTNTTNTVWSKKEAHLDKVAAGALDARQLQEVGGDQERLHGLGADGDGAVVGVVDELLEGGGVQGADAHLGLPRLRHLVQEHGVEVGDAGGEHDPVRRELGLVRHQSYVAQFACQARSSSQSEVVGCCCVASLFFFTTVKSRYIRHRTKIKAYSDRKVSTL